MLKDAHQNTQVWHIHIEPLPYQSDTCTRMTNIGLKGHPRLIRTPVDSNSFRRSRQVRINESLL